VEEERKNALEMGKEEKKEDKESAKEKSWRTLVQPRCYMRIVGLDLAGSEKRTTGFCYMNEMLNCKTKALHTDKEIIESTLAARPDVISIDAPLCLPKGRKNLEQRGAPHLRQCDKELQKMHIRFFPITLGPMRMLTSRGIKFKRLFEKMGLEVIESFPGSAQDILDMPRKQEGLEKLRRSLIRYGVRGDVRKKGITDDELDGITCAIVGMKYLQDDCTVIGDREEGYMILPKKKSAPESHM
jgi:predicted nuclease with RNAse H fold